MAAINESLSPAAPHANITIQVGWVILNKTPIWMAIAGGSLCLVRVSSHE